MPVVFKIIFLLSLGSMVVIYPLYYVELSALGRAIRQYHPSLMPADDGLSAAYKVMWRIKNGELNGVKLAPEACRSCLRAKKLLYIGAALFLIVLGIGLTDGV